MYPIPASLQYPVTPYVISGYHFKERLRRHIILWATHIGDDIVVSPGTSVVAIGNGEVVYSEMRLGMQHRRNWGGLVVIGHKHLHTNQSFFSVYGHISDLAVKVGDTVAAGQALGVVATGLSPENGWWKIPHLHFAIYTGPWQGQVLPGYKRPEEWRTRLKWWQNPEPFIQQYNRPVH